MIRFFVKSSIFVLIVASYVIGVVYLAPVDQDTYIGATVEKQELLRETGQPRIVFIGGSSLAFGLDSRMIRERTGFNTVNMGLHGGLGPLYYVNEVKPHLREGDILILILEYEFYTGLYFDGRTTLNELTIFYPRAVLYFSPEHFGSFFGNLPITFQRRLRGLMTEPGKKDAYTYVRSGFNEHGDYVKHLGVPPKIESTYPVLVDEIDKRVVDLIKDLREFCGEKGVPLFLSFPPIMVQETYPGHIQAYSTGDDVKKMFEEFFLEEIKPLDIETIGRPGDFVYPVEYFFDTIYHLNETGRRVRTEKLIVEMEKTGL